MSWRRRTGLTCSLELRLGLTIRNVFFQLAKNNHAFQVSSSKFPTFYMKVRFSPSAAFSKQSNVCARVKSNNVSFQLPSCAEERGRCGWQPSRPHISLQMSSSDCRADAHTRKPWRWKPNHGRQRGRAILQPAC